MKKVSNNILTSNQFMCMLIASMVGIGIMSLPNDVVKNAKQDGWISTFLGCVYPLYVVIMGSFIQKKFPNKNILIVNKKCYGKVLGTILNLFLLSFFLLILTSELPGLSNIIRGIIVYFLTPIKIYILTGFLAAFTAYKGLKVLGRVNETIFYLTLFMSSLLIIAIYKGKLINITPVFSSGMLNILKASKESAYQYSGMEMYLLIYPYVSDSKNLKKYAFKSMLITALIYTWLVFSTIYSLGVDIIPKVIVSVPLSLKYIEIPIINNYRFIFMMLWTLVVMALNANYYYASVHILNNVVPKISEKKWCIILYPIVIYLSTRYKNGIIRKNFLGFIIPKLVGAMIIYILITVVIIYLRQGDKHG